MSMNWNSIAGSRFDVSAFVTNLADKQYYNYISGGYAAYGFESGQVAEPRMYGARLRYNFGK
jgi:iron complex outermembrane recepter protein